MPSKQRKIAVMGYRSVGQYFFFIIINLIFFFLIMLGYYVFIYNFFFSLLHRKVIIKHTICRRPICGFI